MQEENGQYSLWAINADGSNQRKLAEPANSIYVTGVTPSGDRLLVHEELDEEGTGNIFLISPDGSNRIDLETGVDTFSSASLSPDGTKVAVYVSAAPDGRKDTLYIVDRDGLNRLTLMDPTGGVSGLPAFSADGERLLVMGSGGIDLGAVRLVNTDETGAVEIYRGQLCLDAGFVPYSDKIWIFQDPGCTTVFAYGGCIIGEYRLLRVNQDGTGEKELANSRDLGECFDFVGLESGPEGNLLIFRIREANHSLVKALNLDTKEVETWVKFRVGEFPLIYGVVISPDRKRALLSYKTDRYHLLLLSTDLSSSMDLAEKIPGASNGAFSPDGKWVVFWDVAPLALYIARSDGENVVKLVDGGLNPLWLPAE